MFSYFIACRSPPCPAEKLREYLKGLYKHTNNTVFSTHAGKVLKCRNYLKISVFLPTVKVF
jgi:hypothetical protein